MTPTIQCPGSDMKREIGRFHTLNILEVGARGAILDGGAWGDLPIDPQECPAALAPADSLDVFVYLDGDGKPAATTVRPAAASGEIAWLKVVDVTDLGAFVAWGPPKDLFIPFAQQQQTLKQGSHTLVRVYVDNQGRLAGSTRIDAWLEETDRSLKRGDRVSLLIADRTELGFKAIVNHRCWGLLYSNELYRDVRKGQRLDGYVQRIRDDGKIDLSLSQPGFSKGKMEDVSGRILSALEAHDGFLALTDKSPPAAIKASFGVSKKVFKQALGALYKQRLIALESDGIRML